MATSIPTPADTLPRNMQASPAALARAGIGAAAVAGIVLTLFVLPAEYGIDPTGLGSRLGITGMAVMNQDDAAPTASPANTATGTATAIPSRSTIQRTTPWREDELTLDLAPHSGAEIKAHMTKGDSFVFHWKATGGPVKVDTHGERAGAAEGEFTSYWKERESKAGQGELTAPFDGTHGWYWRNKGDTPVRITVKVAGFYKDLFKP